MVSVKALDELTLADLWREVPADRFWEDTEERLRVLLKLVLEGALEEEMVELLAASRYRRVEGRRGYRNGFYERDLVTQIAIVRGVRVSRARGLSPERAVLGRYRRRCAKVDHLIRDVFLRGVSTREVGEVLQELLGEPVSAATVSRVAAALDGEVDRFHQSPLADGWRYLVLDGVYLRVKGATEARRRLVLCAYGIGVDGERRLLDFRLADSESAAAWEAFLNNLHQRGLWAGGCGSSPPMAALGSRRQSKSSTRTCRDSTAGSTNCATWRRCSGGASRRSVWVAPSRSTRRRRGGTPSTLTGSGPSAGGLRRRRRWPASSGTWMGYWRTSPAR